MPEPNLPPPGRIEVDAEAPSELPQRSSVARAQALIAYSKGSTLRNRPIEIRTALSSSISRAILEIRAGAAGTRKNWGGRRRRPKNWARHIMRLGDPTRACLVGKFSPPEWVLWLVQVI